MPNRLDSAEADALVAAQRALSRVPGSVAAARAISLFGEHAAGWALLSGAGAAADRRRREPWLRLGAAAVVSHGASIVIKRLVRRRRPSDPRVEVRVGTPSNLSFPSSHATSSTAALIALSRLFGSRAPLAGIPVVIASRLVAGVHYPGDTLAGAALGAAVASLLAPAERMAKRDER
ncbi:phosphatase PAP2 family protein [Corynebacterium otitidis]